MVSLYLLRQTFWIKRSNAGNQTIPFLYSYRKPLLVHPIFDKHSVIPVCICAAGPVSVWLCSPSAGGKWDPTAHLAASSGSIFSQPSASGNTSSCTDCCCCTNTHTRTHTKRNCWVNYCSAGLGSSVIQVFVAIICRLWVCSPLSFKRASVSDWSHYLQVTRQKIYNDMSSFSLSDEMLYRLELLLIIRFRLG